MHVASHGSRPGGGELSARLGGGEASLTAFQIAGLSFGEGSLAVLGACDSSLDAETGHDNTSLVSAARTAGAEVVIGSLWPIDDQVTVQLFTRFYEELRNGQSPERALQLAQRAVAKTRPHPYYWSGFQVVTGPAR